LRIAEAPAARAREQNDDRLSLYSAMKTALPARANGRSASHSWYWKHCSLSAQSKEGCSAAAWPRSFLRPTDRPRACAADATKRL
jgi:hypothetical protein